MADRWREAELRDALAASGVPPAAFEARGMGYRDGAEDVRGFRRACADGRVAPVPLLLLRSAMAEARTVFRSDRQRKAVERITRRTASPCSRRCGGSGYPCGGGGRAAAFATEAALAV